jgi:hypothetical protein
MLKKDKEVQKAGKYRKNGAYVYAGTFKIQQSLSETLHASLRKK